MNPLIQFSIIIPTCGRPKLLNQTVHSLITSHLDCPLLKEVIIVDNGADGNLHALIHSVCNQFPQVNIYYFAEPRKGLHYGRHRGADEAKADYLIYIDDDVIVPCGWLNAYHRAFLEHPNVAAIAGRVVGNWTCPIPEWVFTNGDPKNCGFLSLMDLGEGCFPLPSGKSFFGCNMAVRKTALRQVGGFNPDGFPDELIKFRGDGESGLLYKLYNEGFTVFYCSDAVLYHVIPSQRLDVTYALERFRRQGISRAFTCSRLSGGSVSRLIADAAASFLLWAYHILHWSWFWNGRPLKHRLRSSYFKTRALHDIRLVFDQELRKYTTKKKYWE